MSIAAGYRGTDVIMKDWAKRNQFLETINNINMEKIIQILDKLAKNGGKIVSSAQCTELEIAQAQSCGRMYIDKNGFGFIYFP